MTLPCRDCITLAICKGIVYHDDPDRVMDGIFLTRLSLRCSILREYVSKDHDDVMRRIYKVLDFFIKE
jgi:hypothetical protein